MPYTSRRFIVILLIMLGLIAFTLNVLQKKQNLQSRADTPTNCIVSDKLVNSCRPWLGAYANSYPGHESTGLKDQILDHEARIGRQVDFVHYYHSVGSFPLNSDEKYFINRPNTYAVINWKPAAKWADAAGGNNSINADIDKVADSIKSVAPHKVLLVLHHEPENDVSTGSNCPNLKGHTAGSPQDFVNMWHNVRQRFDARGATNVVWGFIITGYNGWYCMVNDLYPGDNYVDWIMFDIYGGSNNDPFDQSAQDVYTFLTQNSNGTHNYLSKPWGIGETSNFNTDKELSWKYWDDAKLDVETNKYPNIKLWMVFDSKNGDGDFRVGFDKGGAPDPIEQQHYNAFANSPAFAGTASASLPVLTPPNSPTPTCAPKDTRSFCLINCSCTNNTDITCEQGSVPSCTNGKVCIKDSYSKIKVSCAFPTLAAPPPPPCNKFNTDGSCNNIKTALGDFNVAPASFISEIVAILLSLSGGVGLVLIIRAAYRILTSAGKQEAVQEARNELIATIVGLLFIIFSYVVLEVITVDILRIPGLGS